MKYTVKNQQNIIYNLLSHIIDNYDNHSQTNHNQHHIHNINSMQAHNLYNVDVYIIRKFLLLGHSHLGKFSKQKHLCHYKLSNKELNKYYKHLYYNHSLGLQNMLDGLLHKVHSLILVKIYQSHSYHMNMHYNSKLNNQQSYREYNCHYNQIHNQDYNYSIVYNLLHRNSIERCLQHKGCTTLLQ